MKSNDILFQSTLPLRGATRGAKGRTYSPPISIHAPLTGSDRYMRDGAMDIFISIHAPLTGSDWLTTNLL